MIAWKDQHVASKEWLVADMAMRAQNHPATYITWYEARAFCAWLTAREHAAGCLNGALVIRLPSEDEWERAARGGLVEHELQLIPETLWQNGPSAGIGWPAPVGLFPVCTSPCGALDMAGNVWEWCGSRYDGHHDTLVATLAIDERNAVARGGSFATKGEEQNLVRRQQLYPDSKSRELGLRLVLGAPVSAP